MLFDSQDERSALINLMLIARYSDQQLTLAEQETFDKIASQLNWQDKVSESHYIDQAILEVREVYASGGLLDEYISRQCAVFSDQKHRQLAVKKIESLLLSDGLTPEENRVFETIKQQMGLSD